MNKTISRINNDGEIEFAVLISFGNGLWFSHHDDTNLLFHDGIINALMQNKDSVTPLKEEELRNLLQNIANNNQLPSVPDLDIYWIPIGTKFTVIPHDDEREEILFHDACIWVTI